LAAGSLYQLLTAEPPAVAADDEASEEIADA
jgi:hypothetical protein